MGAKAELQRIGSQRLVPIVADLELVVHRNGYSRVLGATLSMLGVLGLLGQVLGSTWLRAVFATLAFLLFFLTSALTFAATKSLRERADRGERLLHEYARAVHASAPVSIREWSQEVTIDADGSALVTRRLVLDAAADTVPRHLSVNLVYYGGSKLTERGQRQVTYRTYHREADGTGDGVRATTTSVWSASAAGMPRLDVYVHLGTVVRDGDVVTTEWHWPGYSADLMSGKSPEQFDVLFTKDVASFRHRVVFRDVRRDSDFSVRSLGAPHFTRERKGRDVEVVFWADRPPMGERFGFVADYRGSG